MSPKRVWAEIGLSGNCIRIFKNLKATVSTDSISYVLRAAAVEQIRRQIWERDKQRCTHCGVLVGWNTMQMHEKIWRGRGGEVSVENGVTLCSACHIDDPVAGHGKRKVRFGK